MTNVMGAVTVDLPANRVRDRAGNGNTAATQLSVPVDNSPASVTSIARHSSTPSRGSDGQTNSDTLAFEVTFSEAVDNVDAADFDATGTSGADATGVTGSGTTRVVTVSGGNLGSHEGEVGLDLRRQPGHRGCGRQRAQLHDPDRDRRELHPRQHRGRR